MNSTCPTLVEITVLLKGQKPIATSLWNIQITNAVGLLLKIQAQGKAQAMDNPQPQMGVNVREERVQKTRGWPL